MKIGYSIYNKCKASTIIHKQLWGTSNIRRKNKLKNKLKKKQSKKYKKIYRYGKKNYVLQMISLALFRIYYNPKLSITQIKNKLYFKNNTFKRFLYSLECRLDTILYRSYLSYTLQDAKKLIKLNNIIVNNKLISSYEHKLNIFDVIEVKLLSKIQLHNHIMKNIINKYYKIRIPSYLEVDFQLLSCSLIHLPKMQDITFPFILPIKLFRYKLLQK